MPKLYVTKGSDQSYIQTKNGTTMSLLISCSSKQHKHHKRVIELIVEHLEAQHSSSKALAQSIRSALIG